jgi:hypothetical protein
MREASGQRGKPDSETIRDRNYQRSFCHASDFIMIAVLL